VTLGLRPIICNTGNCDVKGWLLHAMICGAALCGVFWKNDDRGDPMITRPRIEGRLLLLWYQ
jgi:hypothetical protein